MEKNFSHITSNMTHQTFDMGTDQVGTIIKTVKHFNDFSTTVKQSKTYNVFGNVVSTTGSSTGNLGFQSKYFDTESGMYYYYNRYYKPDLGRFLNEDPIGMSGGFNLYHFTFNNPINLIDLFGLKSIILNAGGMYIGDGIWVPMYQIGEIDPRTGDINLGPPIPGFMFKKDKCFDPKCFKDCLLKLAAPTASAILDDLGLSLIKNLAIKNLPKVAASTATAGIIGEYIFGAALVAGSIYCLYICNK